MEREVRTAVYDGELGIEAYRLTGLSRPFPKHCHDCYVIGLVEEGARALVCAGREYSVKSGDILAFNPGESHACTQSGGGALDYRSLNIPGEVMLNLAEQAGRGRELPRFSPAVIQDGEAAGRLRRLHQLVMEGSCGPEREEQLALLLLRLIDRYGRPSPPRTPEYREEVERACTYMEEHYAQRIGLDQLCRCAGLSKSTLLRAFGRTKGVTPYGYLENLRIDRARQLLRQGVPPAEAALRTGFSDQSHLTNRFSRFLGLPPGAYREVSCLKREEKQDGLAK